MDGTSFREENAATEQGLRIGVLAAALGLNPKTIRYYEDIGVLPTPRRTPSGYRLYDAADRERLEFILKARAIGLTLEEIGDVLSLQREGQAVCVHVLALLERKIAGIDQQLRALKDVRAELVDLRRRAVKDAPKDGTVCGIIDHHELTRGDWAADVKKLAHRPQFVSHRDEPSSR